MSFSGKVWVISGVMSNPALGDERQNFSAVAAVHPPVLKVRFLPYISGSGSIWGRS